jgi:hypothetical protein
MPWYKVTEDKLEKYVWFDKELSDQEMDDYLDSDLAGKWCKFSIMRKIKELPKKEREKQIKHYLLQIETAKTMLKHLRTSTPKTNLPKKNIETSSKLVAAHETKDKSIR